MILNFKLARIKNIFQTKVLKAGLCYTIGNYFLKGISLITVPIFVRMMSTSDYGMFNTFLAYESVLYLIICLGLHSSIKNAKYQFPRYLDEYVSSITLLPMAMFCISLIIINVFSNPLSEILDLDRISLNLLIAYSYGSGLIILYQSRLAVDYEYKKYLCISYINAGVNIVLSIVLMSTIFRNNGYIGRIIGSVIPILAITLYILYDTFKRSKPRYNKQYYSFGLKLSLPIVPHGLSQVVLVSFDRIMISKMVGYTEAGIYSFAYTLYSILSITGTSISTVFEPWAFERLKEGDIKILKKRGSQLIVFLGVICGVVILFSPELIDILGSEKYADSIFSVIPIVLAGFFAMAYSIPAVIEYYSGKTQYIALGTAGAALVNIVLNAILIPRCGYIAAPYTTLVSYILYFLFHSLISLRIIGSYIIDIFVLIITIIGIFLSAYWSLIYKENFIARFAFLIIIGVISILYITLSCKIQKKIKEV